MLRTRDEGNMRRGSYICWKTHDLVFRERMRGITYWCSAIVCSFKECSQISPAICHNVVHELPTSRLLVALLANKKYLASLRAGPYGLRAVAKVGIVGVFPTSPTMFPSRIISPIGRCVPAVLFHWYWCQIGLQGKSYSVGLGRHRHFHLHSKLHQRCPADIIVRSNASQRDGLR